MDASDADDAFTIEALGETTLLIRFGNRIDADLNARVHDAAAILRAARLPGVVDLVAAYASLALVYAPSAWSDGDDMPWRQLADAVRAVFSTPSGCARVDGKRIDIPVCYGGADGPDLQEIARRAGLEPAEVIARHTACDYRVAMIGFAPGFPYLLGLDDRLHTPRRSEPRTHVPRGSVAIGGAQTGIYPRDLPGGWHLIGRTPLILFDTLRAPPCLLGAGDHVCFRAIDRDEFDALESGVSP